jgi:pyruvate formate lyase activating enzyme
LDQIEKKPVYHYQPGSKLLSIGTFGCNLDCDCCQNAALASAAAEEVECPRRSPEEMVSLALGKEVQGIAFTFNEPIVWFEFVMDTAHAARDAGLYTMMNSNGFIEAAPLRQLMKVVDVFNVDVKGFRDEFYVKHCGGSLAPVLRTCERISEQGKHLELAYLIIPGLNDSTEELEGFFDWVIGKLGNWVPVHLYRFMPAYRLSHLPPTDMSVLRTAKSMARCKGLDFVYISGMVEEEEHSTACPRCGLIAIEREAKEGAEKVAFGGGGLSKFCPSYSDIIDRTEHGRCIRCGHIIYRNNKITASKRH